MQVAASGDGGAPLGRQAIAPIDQLGKLVFDIVAIALFAYLTWRLRTPVAS